MDGYGDEKDSVRFILHHDLCHRGSFYLVQRTFSMKYIKSFIIIAGFLLLCFGIYRPAKSQEQTKLHVIEVTSGFSATIAPDEKILGFACTSDERMLAPSCYVLVK